MQKSLIVVGHWNTEEDEWVDTTEELNDLFAQGYKFVSATPMGAYGFGYGNGSGSGYSHYACNGFASLVIVEK